MELSSWYGIRRDGLKTGVLPTSAAGRAVAGTGVLTFVTSTQEQLAVE
jgi:hypothetical protein